MAKARLVGINHVALQVGDLEAALEFYSRVFDFELRGRVPGMAFLDIGDQFLALAESEVPRGDPADAEAEDAHFGLVVDDREAVRAALEAAGVEILPSRSLDFRDPWGNHVQVVEYGRVQFTKSPAVLTGIGLGDLEKSPEALQELREKGIGGD